MKPSSVVICSPAARTPDDYAMTVQETEVECVSGLTHLEHHVVGNIGDIVHRPLPDRFEAIDEPLRRWRDFYSPNNTRGISRAQVGVENLDSRGRFRALVRFIYDDFARSERSLT